jgi:hypothetical protein
VWKSIVYQWKTISNVGVYSFRRIFVCSGPLQSITMFTTSAAENTETRDSLRLQEHEDFQGGLVENSNIGVFWKEENGTPT